MTTIQPQVASEYFTERDGVLAFAQAINKLRFVWRETSNADVGVDGQVEHVDEKGNCTGRVIAVQVKAGASYFLKGDAENIYFYPEEKHRSYWRSFPVPVIVALMAPDTRTIYWIDARRYLRSPSTSNDKAIRIPKTHTLSDENKYQLFESYGPANNKLLLLKKVVKELLSHESKAPIFKVSYFELFALGLIDVGTKLFFSMTLAMEIAEWHAAQEATQRVSFDSPASTFIDEYIDFLMEQNLIYYDYSDYIVDYLDRGLHPIFICPLTDRGRQLVDLLIKLQGKACVIHESFLSLADSDELSSRLVGLKDIAKKIKKQLHK